MINFKKLKELSGVRLSNNEKYQNLKEKQNQVETIKQQLFSIENQINAYRTNSTYENDHFNEIDKLEIRKEELENLLKKLVNEQYKVIPSSEYDEFEWVLSLNECIDYIELLGIVDLMKDPKYTEVLIQNSVEIGIPELCDKTFGPKLASISKTNNIDSDILVTDIINNGLNSNCNEFFYKPELITKYINRLINVVKATSIDNVNSYKQNNEKYLSMNDGTNDFCYQYNILDAACSVYGEELGIEFLTSLISDEFYNQIDSGYTISCFLDCYENLIDKENGKIKSPQKLYASLIKAYNGSGLEEDEIRISDFKKNENGLLNENLVSYIFEIDAPEFSVTDDEVNQIINAGKRI